MTGDLLSWLIHSTAGLWTRVGAGVVIFACLAIVDLKRNGRTARRWREYLFLLACVVLALAYGAINDQITVGISWEYFYYGKGLEAVLGGDRPPAAGALRWEAAKVGLMATWSAGLIVGVAMLLANNPTRQRPPLPFGRLFGLMPVLLAVTVGMAVGGGVLGRLGLLNWMSEDFAAIWTSGQFRPARFMTVYGVHLGGYVGGAIGVMVTVVRIKLCRPAVEMTFNGLNKINNV